jgi:hypothetical protein
MALDDAEGSNPKGKIPAQRVSGGNNVGSTIRCMFEWVSTGVVWRRHWTFAALLDDMS